MQDFRNLKVWQRAHDLALLTYKLTADFPREETFGLRHSLRKTAVDIPAYIAEGAEGELAEGKVTLKNMKTGEQESFIREEVARNIK